MAKYLIFDMDGVIVDSEAVNMACEIAVLEQAGIEVDHQAHTQYLGVSVEAMWEELKTKHSLPLPVADYVALTEQLKHNHFETKGVQAIEGVEALIHWLVDKGWQLAVASSSSKANIIHHLASLRLDQDFEITVSAEEVGASKPAPDVFLKAAELLGATPQECLVIEDSTNGSLAAKAAGMTCIGFANPDYPAQDLSACDLIITDYDQIYAYLED